MTGFIVTTSASVRNGTAAAGFAVRDAQGKLVLACPMHSITSDEVQTASKALATTNEPVSCHLAAYVAVIGAMYSVCKNKHTAGRVITADFITTPLVADQINGISKCKSPVLQPIMARCQAALKLNSGWRVYATNKESLF
jgi:hypothetical protein